MKMPTIVGIFIFISRENFMLSWVEHEKSSITLGPDQTAHSCSLISLYFTVSLKMLKNLGYQQSALWSLQSDCVDVKADLSLSWATCSLVAGAVPQLKYLSEWAFHLRFQIMRKNILRYVSKHILTRKPLKSNWQTVQNTASDQVLRCLHWVYTVCIKT